MEKVCCCVLALSLWVAVARADSPRPEALATCDNAVVFVMTFEKATMDRITGMGPELRKRLKRDILAICAVDRWSADFLQCAVYARKRSELRRCDDKLTPKQRDRLSNALTGGTIYPDAVPNGFIDDGTPAPDPEHVALVEKRQSDPKWMGPRLSAVICVRQDAKAAVAKEVQTEQARAKPQDDKFEQAKIDDLQQQIRAIDDAIAQVRDVMRSLKASAQSCQTKLIRQIAACIRPDVDSRPDPACQTKQISEYLELHTSVD